MKYLWLAPMVILSAASFAEASFAFTTDSRPSQNSDGTAKFADPDEQMPGFMVSPDQTHTPSSGLSFSATTTTVPTLGDTTPGARAFDDAYARQQQDKE